MKAGWQQATVGLAAEFVSTGPFGSMLHKADYVEGGIPLVNPINLIDGSIVHDASKTVSQTTAERLTSYALQAGDILVARRGDIGRCAVAQVQHAGWLCGTGCFFVRPSSQIQPEFLARMIGSPVFREKLVSASTGATMANISNTTLATLEIPIPPLDEQRQIIAVLDEAFEGLARARANAEANLQNARELFTASVDALLERDSTSWWTGKFSDTVGPVSTGPFGSLLHKSDYVENGTPLVNPANIIDGRVVPDRSKTLDGTVLERMSSYVLQTNDIVVGRRGEMGRCAVIGEEQNGWVCGTGSFFVRPTENVISSFVAHLLRSPTYVAKLEAASTGATMANISNRALAELEISLPKKDDQIHYLERIEALEERCLDIAASFINKADELNNLRQSLLQKAFAGELT